MFIPTNALISLDETLDTFSNMVFDIFMLAGNNGNTLLRIKFLCSHSRYIVFIKVCL